MNSAKLYVRKPSKKRGERVIMMKDKDWDKISEKHHCNWCNSWILVDKDHKRGCPIAKWDKSDINPFTNRPFSKGIPDAILRLVKKKIKGVR